jgi:hypothetical protein
VSRPGTDRAHGGTVCAVQIDRVRRPFWIHQVVEYLVGLALISVAFQSPKPAVPAVMGLLIILNAAITEGAAGAFRLVHRRVHKWIDVVLMVLLLVMAAQQWADIDIAGRLLLAAIAVVLGFVWFHSDFDDRATKRAARAGRLADRATSEDIGRFAGRTVGQGVNAWKRMRRTDDDE